MSYLLLTLLCLFQWVNGDKHRWNHGGWRRGNRQGLETRSGEPWVRPRNGTYYEIAFEDIADAFDAEGGQIELPLPDGTIQLFSAMPNAVIMSPEVAAANPQIRVFRLQSVEQGGVTGIADTTQHGFHAQIFTPEGTVYIDPFTSGNMNLYSSYYAVDADTEPIVRNILPHKHTFHPTGFSPEAQEYQRLRHAGLLSGRGTNVHVIYKLASACTYEYTARFGSQAAAYAQIVTTFSRVGGLFERELGISLQLVSGQEFCFSSSTNPYPSNAQLSNSNGAQNIQLNQQLFTSKLAIKAYDLGHILSTGQSGGISYVGGACQDSYKAGSGSGVPNPTGDAFYTQVVAHELGHMLGSPHTFNGLNTNSPSFQGYCTTDQYGGGAEPGSGLTIMSYAGLCGSQNYADVSSTQDFYHTYSLHQITNYVFSSWGSTCGTRVTTSLAAPRVTVEAGGSMPINTPFMLVCSATPGNAGDTMYYTWEEADFVTNQHDINAPTGNDPILRSVYPSATGQIRFFPNLRLYAAGAATPGERLPSYSRTLTMRCTARSRAGIATSNTGDFGLFGDADIVFSVTSGAGPFTLTQPTGSGQSITSSPVTVRWNVANTNVAPVSATLVNIYLSTDSGITWYNTAPVASLVSNSGSATVTLPAGTSTTRGRFIVQAVHTSHFFAMSSADISINIAQACVASQCVSPPPCFTSAGAICASGSCAYTTRAADNSNCNSLSGAAGYCSSGVCVTCPQTCNSPPACRTSTGATCVAGKCVYPVGSTGASCISGSVAGICSSSGSCQTCSGVTCNSPSECQVSGSGVCSGGVCSYTTKSSGSSCNTLAGFCSGLTCVTCASVSCNSPPDCRASPGTCSNGVCAYNTRLTSGSCASGQGQCDVNGICQTCSTVSCNSPPVCRTTTSSCSAGVCTYPVLSADGTACNSGGVAGTCKTGSCLTCASVSCPTVQCQNLPTPACSNGVCQYTKAAAGSACTLNGVSGVCNSANPPACVTCSGVTCNSPPTCYASSGSTCSNGVCSYPTPLTGTGCTANGLAGQCQNGICVTCSSISCNSPPTCYASQGTCSNGVCAYPNALASGSSCTSGGQSGQCQSGVCNTCATVTCTPGPCRSASCANGVCSYTSNAVNSACSSGGLTGFCDASENCVTCASVTCTSTPPTPCTGAGVCSAGVCSYPTLSDGSVCTSSGVAGTCSAGSCVTCTCDAPPTCRTATGATCSNGVCNYPSIADNNSCTDASNNPGYCKTGSCVTCGNSPCPPVPCQTASCNAGRCTYTNQPVSVACTTGGGYAGQCLNGACRACADPATAPVCTTQSVPCQASTTGVCTQSSTSTNWCVYPMSTVGTACIDQTSGLLGLCVAPVGSTSTRTCATCANTPCNAPPACRVTTGSTCANGICNYPNLAAQGTTCASGTCDGDGHCVSSACTCNAPPKCRTATGATCTNGVCNYPLAPALSACMDATNNIGTCQSGVCVSCASNPCHPTSCQTATCSNGVCTYTSNCPAPSVCQSGAGQCINGVCTYANAPSTTECASSGYPYYQATAWCNAGTCAYCSTNACKAPPTCRVTTGVTCPTSATSCVWQRANTNTLCVQSTGSPGLCNAAGNCVACSCASLTCRTSTCRINTLNQPSCSYIIQSNGSNCSGGHCCGGTCCTGTCVNNICR